MGIAAYNRGTRAISRYIDQQLREAKEAGASIPAPEPQKQDLAPDGLPWITREPNRPTPHAENGWQYHYPRP